MTMDMIILHRKQARNAGSLNRGNIKIIKQIIQQLFEKYRGDIMKTYMGLPEIDFALFVEERNFSLILLEINWSKYHFYPKKN